MKQRINPYHNGFKAVKPLLSFGPHLAKSSVEQSLLHLLSFRVSQINGCAFCLDMHSKDLGVMGESEQRLYVLDAWREAPFYTDRERAALAWAEAVNKIPNSNVPDEVYEEACRHFTEEELIDLTISVIGTTSFNRINIAFRVPAGTYEPGQHAVLLN